MHSNLSMFGDEAFDAFLDSQAAKYAHVRTDEIGQLIERLASSHADKVRLPEDETEWCNTDAALVIRLENAAVRAPKDDEEAIQRAIYDELDRVLRDYGRRG